MVSFTPKPSGPSTRESAKKKNKGEWQRESVVEKKKLQDKKIPEKSSSINGKESRSKAKGEGEKKNARVEGVPRQNKSHSNPTDFWDFPTSDSMPSGDGESLMEKFERERLAMRNARLADDAPPGIDVPGSYHRESDDIMLQLSAENAAMTASGRKKDRYVTGAEWSGGSPPPPGLMNSAGNMPSEPDSPMTGGFGGGLIGNMPGYDRFENKSTTPIEGAKSLTASELMHNAAAIQKQSVQVSAGDMSWMRDVMPSPSRANQEEDFFSFKQFLDPTSPMRISSGNGTPSWALHQQQESSEGLHSGGGGGGGGGRSSSTKSSRLGALLGIPTTPTPPNSTQKSDRRNAPQDDDHLSTGIRVLSFGDDLDGGVPDYKNAFNPPSAPPGMVPAAGVSSKGLKKLSVNSLFGDSGNTGSVATTKIGVGEINSSSSAPTETKILTPTEAMASFVGTSTAGVTSTLPPSNQRTTPAGSSVLSTLGFSPENDSPLSRYHQRAATTTPNSSSPFVFHSSGATPTQLRQQGPLSSGVKSDSQSPPATQSTVLHQQTPNSSGGGAGVGSAKKGSGVKLSVASRLQLQKMKQPGGSKNMKKLDVSSLFDGAKSTPNAPTAAPKQTVVSTQNSSNSVAAANLLMTLKAGSAQSKS